MAASTPRTVTVKQNVLSRNDQIAARTRDWLTGEGILAVNLISSPGSGKTTLLTATLDRLADRVACAVIVGDQESNNDADRLVGHGAPVHQIRTHSACHLNAEQIRDAIPEVVTPQTRLLFIENIGNLVCPASFDLGEHFKIALLSTPEGEDKPIKYPVLFTGAEVTLLTKLDLLPYLDWDLALCRDYIDQIHPGMQVFEVSAKTGAGMAAWVDYLVERTATVSPE